MKICSVEGCGGKCKAKGWCSKHYQAFQRHGDPEGGRPRLPPRTDGLKLCSNCGIPKDPGCFHNYAAAKNGLYHYCKPCNKIVADKWRKENIERSKAADKIWKQENREKTRAYDRKAYWKDPVKAREDNRKYRKENPHMTRRNKLLSRFGLTLKDYDMMFAAQKGVCAICGKSETSPKKKNLCLDHCHVTGKIRGLLCDGCNKGIGCLKDSIPNLSSAIEYLKRSDGGTQK